MEFAYINAVISKARNAVFQLRSSYYRNSSIPTYILKRLFYAIAETSILYGSEIWGVRFRNDKVMTEDGSLAWLKELDKPANNFLKNILCVPQGAPNAGVMLELGVSRCHSRILCRAISFWCRLLRKPSGHLLHSCIEHQSLMMARGLRPWLSWIKDILDLTGFSEVFVSGGPANAKLFGAIFKQRISDISLSDLWFEASQLPSLEHFTVMNDPSIFPERYVELPRKFRRIIALLRLNLKHSLPFDSEYRFCKLCHTALERDEEWDHFLYYCENLPPVRPNINKIRYPNCIRTLTSINQSKFECALSWPDETGCHPLFRIFSVTLTPK